MLFPISSSASETARRQPAKHKKHFVHNSYRHIFGVLQKLYPNSSLVFSCRQKGSSPTAEIVLNIMTSSNSPICKEPLEILVSDSLTANAMAFRANALEREPARIVISKGLMSLLHSESELAFVLAHEIAHIRREHFSPDLPLAMLTPKQLERINKTHDDWEHIADKEALRLLESRVFDPFSSTRLLRRIVNTIALPHKDNTPYRAPINRRIAELERHLYGQLLRQNAR